MMLPGYDVCGECAGEGHRLRKPGDHVGPIIPTLCLACSGVGSVPSDATEEALAEAVGPFVFSPHKVVDTARAALVAYAQSVKEN